MRIPPYLQPGDRIGICCPASKMQASVALYAAEVVQGWGFEVILGETVGTSYHNFSAPDAVRLRDLQRMLDDDSIRAIWFGRGGYGTIRILDQLNFQHFIEAPKWLCGYSDITALHMHVHRHYQIASLHALMCSGITEQTREDPYVQSLRQAWLGIPQRYTCNAHPLNRLGQASGVLIGGNLSLLVNLSGTRSQPNTAGKILFLEDVGEYTYHIDRMLYNLKRAGWLHELAGLIVGAFTDLKDTEEPFGQSVEEIIYAQVKDYQYPVAFGFPVGHQPANYALKIGCPYVLKVTDQGVELREIDHLGNSSLENAVESL
ncbi:MAG: LD-carboxypeptidase [Thermoflavifilum sp.]|nr:LD-carboxypeptidase [Thermoflavifilum sp.]